MSQKSTKLAYIALFAAITLVLGYLEASIPMPVTIPGVKLGLANVAVLIALYIMGPSWALAVMGLKIAVTSLLIGAPSMAIYSLAGSSLAFLGMYACWRFGKLPLVAVSVAAALLHNIGQLTCAIAVMQTMALLVNLPVMVIAACITGAVTGSVALGVLKALPPLKDFTGKNARIANMVEARYAAVTASRRA